MNRVLVVDDSATQRDMISRVLKSVGIKVTLASDGLEALEQIQQNCPDLVVLDIVMPRMNGYEVCRWLRSNVGEELPVVICSSKREEFDRYWGMKQGADAYIAKPFRPQDLVMTVKELLRVR